MQSEGEFPTIDQCRAFFAAHEDEPLSSNLNVCPLKAVVMASLGDLGDLYFVGVNWMWLGTHSRPLTDWQKRFIVLADAHPWGEITGKMALEMIQEATEEGE